MAELIEAVANVENFLEVDTLQNLIGEVVRRREGETTAATAAQARAVLEAKWGSPLTQPMVDEITALVNSVPSGSTSNNKVDRIERLQKITQVLLLAQSCIPRGLPPYGTPAAVRARLGLP